MLVTAWFCAAKKVVESKTKIISASKPKLAETADAKLNVFDV